MKQTILEHVLGGENVFITGSAGVGKSFLLQHIIKTLESRRKRVAITAPTGIAALNIGGATIHSWAGIGLGDMVRVFGGDPVYH